MCELKSKDSCEILTLNTSYAENTHSKIFVMRKMAIRQVSFEIVLSLVLGRTGIVRLLRF